MGIMRAMYNTFLRGASAPLFLWAMSGGWGTSADPNANSFLTVQEPRNQTSLGNSAQRRSNIFILSIFSRFRKDPYRVATKQHIAR